MYTCIFLFVINKAIQKQANYKLRSKRASEEAEVLSKQLNNYIEVSVKLIKQDLPQSLKSASELLEQAETEYNDNAFGPFWDCVEEAAKNLVFFNNGIHQLSGNAQEYYKSLHSREHNFSLFPVYEDIPNLKSLLEKLQTVVRKGQTNFEFATIWEQRKTHEVLIAGFRTLGEAVSNLSSTVENSISDLKNSISLDISRVVQEQIKLRDSLEKLKR